MSPTGEARELPWSVPTRLSYLQAQCRISVHMSEIAVHGIPPYDMVLEYDDKLQHLLDDMPFFQPGAVDMPGQPAWLPVGESKGCQSDFHGTGVAAQC